MTPPGLLRVLALSDTHVGFDLPLRPRVTRARRGEELLAAYERALEVAHAGGVDVVLHAGDLLDRSRVSLAVLDRALAPLRAVARAGTPVVLVPGNHERSRVERTLFDTHTHFHVLDRPRTVRLELSGGVLAVGGFPFQRDARARFGRCLESSRLLQTPADARILLVHQAFEGTVVGVHRYVFPPGPEVVPSAAVPGGLACVVAGHVHRHQVQVRDARGDPLAAPVVVPGSTGRTSFQERDETKGAVLLGVQAGDGGGRLATHELLPLPSRPMHVVDLDPRGLDPSALALAIRRSLDRLPHHAVVRLRLTHPAPPGAEAVLRAAPLRRLAGPGRDVSLPRPARVGRP